MFNLRFLHTVNFFTFNNALDAFLQTKDLIGALGGHLGLWIGMSLISFIEVFELMLSGLKWCVSKIRSNKTTTLKQLKQGKPDPLRNPEEIFKNNWMTEKNKF